MMAGRAVSGLDLLETVAHRVLGVKAPHARKIVIPEHWCSRLGDSDGDRVDVRDSYPWMCLTGGDERRLDPAVDLAGSRPEPHSPLTASTGGLGTSAIPRTWP
jgi:hypothetical protein